MTEIKENLYEIVVLVRPELSESTANGTVRDIAAACAEFDGKVVEVLYCGIKTLCYPIVKQKKAHFLQVNLKTCAQGLVEVERLFSINESIMRFLTLRVEKHTPLGESILIAVKGYKDAKMGIHSDEQYVDNMVRQDTKPETAVVEGGN